MSYIYKILGQSSPSATTNTDVYTVPSGKQALVSTITVANRSSSPATYRIAARPTAESLADKHYIAYDVSVGGNDTTPITIGVSLNSADIITVYSSSASVSFGVFGTEIS